MVKLDEVVELREGVEVGQGLEEKVTFSVMSEYHKMGTNEYPNIFGCHIMY